MKRKKEIICALIIVAVLSVIMLIFSKPVLSDTRVLLAKGEKKCITINMDFKQVDFMSRDKKIATVNSHGEIKAVEKGKTTIIVDVDNRKYACIVIVNE